MPVAAPVPEAVSAAEALASAVEEPVADGEAVPVAGSLAQGWRVSDPVADAVALPERVADEGGLPVSELELDRDAVLVSMEETVELPVALNVGMGAVEGENNEDAEATADADALPVPEASLENVADPVPEAVSAAEAPASAAEEPMAEGVAVPVAGALAHGWRVSDPVEDAVALPAAVPGGDALPELEPDADAVPVALNKTKLVSAEDMEAAGLSVALEVGVGVEKCEETDVAEEVSDVEALPVPVAALEKVVKPVALADANDGMALGVALNDPSAAGAQRPPAQEFPCAHTGR